jgi:hypothetical protein
MVQKQPIRRKEITSRKRTLSLAADNVMKMKAPHSFIVTDQELALQKIEAFKRSLTYMALEQASLIGDNLMHRHREEEDLS